MTSSIDELIENASDAQLRRLLAEGARLSGNPVAACIVGYAVIDDRRLGASIGEAPPRHASQRHPRGIEPATRSLG